MRTLILGFDGLDYYRIQKYLMYLPTFKKLKNFIGRLESTIPPSTAPAWVSMFTGKTPGEHGIYGFINIETRKVMNYNDIRSKKLWDYLEDLRFCVVNVPMTYPPDKNINGLIVSGFPTYTDDFKKIVYPREWASILENKIGLPKDIDEIEFRRKYNENSEKAFEYILALMDKSAEAYLRLMDLNEFDVFWFVFRETDVVQHFYRDEIKIFKIYKKADEILLKFLRKMKNDDWLIVVSDHGHNTVDRVIYVDNLLRRAFTKDSISLKRKLLNALVSLTWRYPSFGKVIQYVKKIFFDENKEILTSNVSGEITYNPDSWSICVQDENLKDIIIDVLNNVKVDGKRAFLNVFKSEEVYENAEVKLPDIFFVPNYGFYPLSGTKFGRDEIIGLPNDPSHNGTHTLDGVFLIYSKNEDEVKDFIGKNKKIWEIPYLITNIFGV